MKKLIVLLLVIGFVHITNGQTYNNFETDSIAASQSYKPSKTQFMIRGYGHTGLGQTYVRSRIRVCFRK